MELSLAKEPNYINKLVKRGFKLMNLLKRFSGNIVYGTGKVVGFVLDGFIGILEIIVSLVVTLGKGLLGILSMGGCLLLIIVGPALLLNPTTFLIIVLLIIIPIVGIKSISYLKYIKYASTEYLFDRADHLKMGKASEFKSFNEYGNKYIRMEEEKRRKEQERRQQEQQRQWEERFRQWNEYQQSQRGSYDYGGGYSGGYQQPFTNPTGEFKKKYEESIGLLGLSRDADFYQVKLAYRQQAKKYHPDINKSPNATEMFQKINDAYEFLSEGNIERYKKMN